MRSIAASVFILFAAFVAIASSQVIDYSDAQSTRPFRVSSQEPGICKVGAFYYNTTTASLRQCNTANVWSDVSSPSGATLAGVDILAGKGDFATNGLTGWTVDGDGTGWSIVAGKLHHTPGSGNKISTAVTVTQRNAYTFNVNVNSVTAGSTTGNLGVNCNSDCTYDFVVGINTYSAVAISDNGATVVEINPDGLSDITITSIKVLDYGGLVLRPGLTTSNVATSTSSLYSNTTGYGNTANGIDSLYNNTTGFNNAANGASSLFLNTTGFYNTANGFQSLYKNTAGISNTSNGGLSLFSNTTGSGNTADGASSLQNNTTGSNNTASGAESGPTTNALSNTSTFGYQASADSSNTAVIGNASVTDTYFGSTSAASKVHAASLVMTLHTPASSAEACAAGQTYDDADYHYVCTATNTLKRVALAAF